MQFLNRLRDLDNDYEIEIVKNFETEFQKVEMYK
jgi:hypothetical protein